VNRAGTFVVAAYALAALAGCGGRTPEPGSSPLPSPSAAPTAIVRAVQAPPWSARDLRALDAALQDALAPSALATSGVAIVDGDGRPLFLRRERVPVAPASTFKLIVATTALAVLGPDYRFGTTFESGDTPSDGVVQGPLYLVGDGDPTLTRDDLRGGVGALVRAGIRAVDGGVVADASAFGGPEVNPAWDPDDLDQAYAAGISALSLDEGTVEFHLTPGALGAPARIGVRPPSNAVQVEGGVLTGYSTDVAIERDPARNTFTFSGRVAARAAPSFYRPVTDLAWYAGGVALAMLHERGIDVPDDVRTGVAPFAGAVLWRHRSAPLRAIVHDMLFHSDNHDAEELLRAVGATRGLGTIANGAAIERAVLQRDGVPQTGLRIVDGSGLAATDRIAPLTLATLLARSALEPDGAILFDDLPRVGLEGTVRVRQVTDALGRVRAKSGHIEGVNALAGYVDTRRHGRISFAIVVNDRRADAGAVDQGIDRTLDLLARS
jgi:D-alanyl-D-alanine carboxypeptidase/D-alanyl-D-alanine-endopeptidase (penicillin-binding protein 4)